MSNGGGFYGRTERVRQAPYYDQVPQGSLPRRDSYDLHPLREERAPHLAQSADPLPPPPLPEQPPVGPEFDPSGSEDDADPDTDPAIDIKPVHRFIPDSWKNFFRRSDSGSKKSWSMPASSYNNNNSTGGVPCSPPHSPSLPGSHQDPYGDSGGSYNSRKELLDGQDAHGSVSGRTYHTGLTYGERVEEYHQRYGYMKSWAGLLRILGCVELLLGAAVFACVCAYIHKDNEWFNMFGYSSPGGAYGAGYYGGGTSGTYYTGPKTPFVLVVAGLAWLVTVIVLVLGMTMYYRTILLDSSWWPLTEFIINLALAVLYMAAAIVYVRDTTRGGLCSYPVFNNGINGVFCRTEAGQTAAIIFLFVTMVVYLIGAIVCLKLWRHEANRRHRERYGHEMQPSEMHAVRSTMVPVSAPAPRSPKQIRDSSYVPIQVAPKAAPTKVLQGTIPSGHIPKPVIVPDYIAKYPTIRTDEERDQYRAVFNDQYAEYKELHAEVQVTLKRFDEMDTMMRSLPQHPTSQTEADRIGRILQDYQKKKNDPTFLEKKERCEYLKSKLSHIKQKIQEYDKVMEWNDGYIAAVSVDSNRLFSQISTRGSISMSSRPNGSPPPYESDNGYHAPTQPAYSYYPDDEFQHFYRWTSPPGILKIMSIIAIVLCVAIFACVASTLAWDSQGAMSGFGYGGGGYGGGGGGYGGGYGSFGGGGYGAGNNYGYGGIGGNYNDPRSGKGFMIAMAAIVFIFTLAVFIIIVSHQSLAESRRFYLAVLILCAVLALLMLIATIVYLMAVNPTAQSSGSAYGNQIAGLCAQFKQPQVSGVFVNQYLYHYCVVEPQEAIAVVFGFLVTAALIIMLVFALKTRQKIRNYGKSNIFWKKVKVIDEVTPPQDVEAWVNNVSAPPEEIPVSAYPENLRGSRSYLDDESNYDKPPLSYTPQPVVEDLPLHNGAPYSSSSEVPSSAGRPKKRRARRPRAANGQDYDTDYNSSGDELDDNDFDSEFPPIRNEQERSSYKQEFDREHQEYKDLQAYLDGINKDLSELDRELDRLEEGSPQYLDALDEYDRMRSVKKSPDYQVKKRRCKHLKSKLNHIKKMVSDYDRRA
ncbi:MARVEL domain-containing protein 2 [Cololabis saira]|uniref:MARVEL domain-containing protein 2 n=1 Tax=Cololabis saira TaxID=129043 RepID=UPI002AD58F3B|nr:MARVEL domain-containing protein 2 [Cololabis saira]